MCKTLLIHICIYLYICVCVYVCVYTWEKLHVMCSCVPHRAAGENPWHHSVTYDWFVWCCERRCAFAVFAFSCLPWFPAKGVQFCLKLQLLREASSSTDYSSDKPVLLLPSGGFKTNGASAPGIYHLEDTLLLSCDISLHFYVHLYNCFLWFMAYFLHV